MTNTKIDILKIIHGRNVLNWQKVFKQDPYIIQSAMIAMGEYAKQQAIEFGIYLATKQGCVPRTEEGIVMWYFTDGENIFKSDTEKLYELFINRK